MLANTLRNKIARGQQDGVVADETYRVVERFAESLSGYMNNALETGKVEKTAFRSPLPDLMQVAADQKLTDSKTAYILNPENTVGVVQVTAIRNSKISTEDPNAAAISRLRELAAEVEKAHESQPGDVSIA